MKSMVAILEQSKKIQREPVKTLINAPKPAQATELPRELNKMVAEPMEELDVEALLAESTEFIHEGEYSKNLPDDQLNNDDLLYDLQDDPATVAAVRIISF